MSKKSTQKITCPKCGHEQEEVIWDSVNVTIDPEAKQKIKDGNFFTFHCAQCGYEAPLAYPCLYHDMEQGLLAWLLPGNGNKERNLDQINSMISGMGIDFTNEEKPYSYRIVEDANDLKEKILIFDEGLDDRMVEIMKVIYRVQIEEQVGGDGDFMMYLSGTKNRYEFVVLFSDGKAASVPVNMDFYRELYQTQKEMLDACTPSSFCSVDREWAEAIMDGMDEEEEEEQ